MKLYYYHPPQQALVLESWQLPSIFHPYLSEALAILSLNHEGHVLSEFNHVLPDADYSVSSIFNNMILSKGLESKPLFRTIIPGIGKGGKSQYKPLV